MGNTHVAERAALDTARAAKVAEIIEAAALANVTEHSVYAVLQDAARRAAIFPGAYHTNPDNRRRGEWRIPRSQVEAWQPRRV
jgi:hypothetical protein